MNSKLKIENQQLKRFGPDKISIEINKRLFFVGIKSKAINKQMEDSRECNA